MHEVINFSCSQASGHLITQLYNVQESHLPYTRNKTLTHANDVFLVASKVKGRTNYYPRSINVEFQGGFGYLGKYEYHGSKIEPELMENVDIRTQERRAKNEFQLNLDAGKPTDSLLLSKHNTEYWTDYNKLIYRPDLLISLGGFSHPEGTHKNFPRLKFENYNVGEEEFKALRDEIDDFFRKNLELLDQIQGVNFFTECDSAWAGFTGEMMTFLRDEYFGNGVSSKYNLWTYGLFEKGDKPPKIDTYLTRIRAMTELAANSTLFMPISSPKAPEANLSSNYDSSSLWHRAATQSMFVNSLWGLNCQADNPVSMATIENNLLRGNSSRNVVNEVFITLAQTTREKETQFGIVGDVNIMDMYLDAGQTLEKPLEVERLSLGLTLGNGKHTYAKGVIGKRQPELGKTDLVTDTYVNGYMDEITKIDTFPDILQTSEFGVEFSQTDSLKYLLKDYRKTVERVKLPQHMEILGDKAEVIESLSSLMQEYTTGYSDESDFDD